MRGRAARALSAAALCVGWVAAQTCGTLSIAWPSPFTEAILSSTVIAVPASSQRQVFPFPATPQITVVSGTTVACYLTTTVVSTPSAVQTGASGNTTTTWTAAGTASIAGPSTVVANGGVLASAGGTVSFPGTGLFAPQGSVVRVYAKCSDPCGAIVTATLPMPYSMGMPGAQPVTVRAGAMAVSWGIVNDFSTTILDPIFGVRYPKVTWPLTPANVPSVIAPMHFLPIVIKASLDFGPPASWITNWQAAGANAAVAVVSDISAVIDCNAAIFATATPLSSSKPLNRYTSNSSDIGDISGVLFTGTTGTGVTAVATATGMDVFLALDSLTIQQFFTNSPVRIEGECTWLPTGERTRLPSLTTTVTSASVQWLHQIADSSKDGTPAGDKGIIVDGVEYVPPGLLPRFVQALTVTGAWTNFTAAAYLDRLTIEGLLPCISTLYVIAEPDDIIISGMSEMPFQTTIRNGVIRWPTYFNQLAADAATFLTQMYVETRCAYLLSGEVIMTPLRYITVTPMSAAWATGTPPVLQMRYNTPVQLNVTIAFIVRPAKGVSTISCYLSVASTRGLVTPTPLSVTPKTVADDATTLQLELTVIGAPNDTGNVTAVCSAWGKQFTTPPLPLRVVSVTPMWSTPLSSLALLSTAGGSPLLRVTPAGALILRDDTGAVVNVTTTKCALSLVSSTFPNGTASIASLVGANTYFADASAAITLDNIAIAASTTSSTGATFIIGIQCNVYADDGVVAIRVQVDTMPVAPSVWLSLPPSVIEPGATVSAFAMQMVTLFPSHSDAVALSAYAAVARPNCTVPQTCLHALLDAPEGSAMQAAAAGRIHDAYSAAFAATLETARQFVSCTASFSRRTAGDNSTFIANAEVARPDTNWTITFDRLSLAARAGSAFDIHVACSLGDINIPATLTASVSVGGCPAGTSQSQQGGWSCITCGAGEWSEGGVNATCRSCPGIGASCVKGQLQLAKGFYLPPSHASMILDQSAPLVPCANSEACTLNTTAATPAERYGCAEGYTGPFCGSCSPDYSMFGEACRPCWNYGLNALILSILVLLSLAAATFVALRPTTKSRSQAAIAAKILLGFTQGLGTLQTFRSGVTPQFHNLFGFTQGVSSSPFSSGPVQCILHMSFLTTYFLLLALPFIILGTIITIYVIATALRSCVRKPVLSGDSAASSPTGPMRAAGTGGPNRDVSVVSNPLSQSSTKRVVQQDPSPNRSPPGEVELSAARSMRLMAAQPTDDRTAASLQRPRIRGAAMPVPVGHSGPTPAFGTLQDASTSVSLVAAPPLIADASGDPTKPLSPITEEGTASSSEPSSVTTMPSPLIIIAPSDSTITLLPAPSPPSTLRTSSATTPSNGKPGASRARGSASVAAWSGSGGLTRRAGCCRRGDPAPAVGPLRFDSEFFADACKEYFVAGHYLSPLIFVVMAAYMPIISQSLKVLDCTDYSVDGATYLRADLSVQCHAGIHITATIVAWVVLAVVGAGLPIGFALLVWYSGPRLFQNARFMAVAGGLVSGYKLPETTGRRRASIMPGRPSVPAMPPQQQQFQAMLGGGPQSMQAMMQANQPQTVQSSKLIILIGAAYESVIFLRKALLVVISTLIKDAYMQLTAALLLIAVLFWLHVTVRPYEMSYHTHLESVALATMFFTAVCSVFYLRISNPTADPLAAIDDSTQIAVTGVLAAANSAVFAWLIYGVIRAQIISNSVVTAAAEKLQRRLSLREYRSRGWSISSRPGQGPNLLAGGGKQALHKLPPQ